MGLYRPGTLILAGLLCQGCVNHSDGGFADSAPDTDAFVSGTDLHLQDQRNQVFRASGCVNTPGAYHLEQGRPMRLAQALHVAGGTTPAVAIHNGALLSAVQVSRLQNGSIATMTLDARHGHPGEGFLIQPGDEIFVPEAQDKF